MNVDKKSRIIFLSPPYMGGECNSINSLGLWRQDKGHEEEVNAFMKAVKNGGQSPIPFEEIVEVTETTIRLATL